ncbi:MAG: hypothetical protein AB7S38_20850 [Vulcanimicrobiota bacterium]
MWPNPSRRGSILVLALFLMITLFYVGVTFHRLLPTELHAANRLVKDSQAYYAADAGARHAIAFLESETRRGRRVDRENLEGSLGAWSWQARILPLRQGSFRINVSVLDEQASRVSDLVVTLEQDLFSQYAWFEDQLAPQVTIPVSGWRIDGPVRFNSVLRLDGIHSETWQGGRAPFGSSLLVAETTADQFRGDGIRYLGPRGQGWLDIDLRPYDDQGNPLPDRYRRLLRHGRTALRSGVRPLAMEDFRARLQQEATALGPAGEEGPRFRLGVEGQQVTGGVMLPVDVYQIQLVVENPSSRTARIWVVTDRVYCYVLTEAVFGPVDLVDGRRLNQGETALTIYRSRNRSTSDSASADFADPAQDPELELVRVERHLGLTNGLIYCEGNVGSARGGGLRGVNRGARTVAAGGTIFLQGDLLPAELSSLGALTTSGGDTLGVVARTLRINLPDRGGPPRRSDDPLYLYGSYYAGGVASGSDRAGLQIDEPYSGNSGRIELVGGLQVQTTNGGQPDSAMALSLTYDPNISRQPPPYYPRQARFKIVGWATRR